MSEAARPADRHEARFHWSLDLLEEAAAAGRRYAALRASGSAFRWIAGGLLVVLLLGAGARLLGRWPSAPADVALLLAPLALAALIAAGAWALLKFLIWPQLHRRELATAPALRGETVMTLDAEGVRIRSPEGETGVDWSAITHADLSSKALALWTNRMQVILFPAVGADAPLPAIAERVRLWRETAAAVSEDSVSEDASSEGAASENAAAENSPEDGPEDSSPGAPAAGAEPSP